MKFQTVTRESADDANIIVENEALVQEILRSCKADNVATDNNILLIGRVGSGKSSFINTLINVLLGSHKNRAPCGSGSLQSKTQILSWFKNCGVTRGDIQGLSNEEDLRVLLPNLPNVFDFAGLDDENNEALAEKLNYLICGYITPGTTIKELDDLQNEYGIGNYGVRFKTAYPEWKITKIVFVYSCTEQIPTKLIQCLNSVISPMSKDFDKAMIDVDIFAVMTKYDCVIGNEFTGTKREDIENVDGRNMNTSAECQESDFIRDEDSNSDDPGIPMKEIETMETSVAKEFCILGNMKQKTIRWANLCDKIGYKSSPRMVRNGLTFLKHMMTPALEKYERKDELTDWTIWMRLLTKKWYRIIKQKFANMNNHKMLQILVCSVVISIVAYFMYNILNVAPNF